MKEFKFKIGGQDYAATVEDLKDGQMKVTVNGQTYQVEVPQTKAQGPRVAMAPAAPEVQTGGSQTKNVTSELPGTVTKINVADGQRVKRGDVLLVVEAMKMANDIVSEVDGTVQRVAVTQGQSVNQGDLLVEMVADFVAAKAEVTPKPAPAAPAPVAAPAPAPSAPAGSKTVTAPLPGTITKVTVKVGDTVNAGDTVLLMEAMKMENNITAEFGGTVKAILVETGNQVQSGQALVELD